MKLRLCFFAFAVFCISNIQAQKVYTSTQLKLIFSTASEIERNGSEIKSPMRFSGFFNYAIMTNIDLGKYIGVSIGGEIKNIGIILKDSIFRTKHRAYAVGIPLYLRFGNMDRRWYLFAGGQYDYLFGYKEKVFVNGSKLKRIGDYSNDVNPFIPSAFIGFRAKSGTTFSINYMLDNFFSKDYRFKDPTQNDRLFNQGYTNSQIIYFTIGFMGDLDKSSRKKSLPKTSPPDNTTNAYYRPRR